VVFSIKKTSKILIVERLILIDDSYQRTKE